MTYTVPIDTESKERKRREAAAALYTKSTTREKAGILSSD
jgi:hypothetical protein